MMRTGLKASAQLAACPVFVSPPAVQPAPCLCMLKPPRHKSPPALVLGPGRPRQPAGNGSMWFVVSWLAMFAWATPCVSQCAKHYTSLSACTACLVGCTLKSCRPRFAFALRSHALAAVASDTLMPSASSQHCTAVLQSCNTPPAQHNTGSIHIQSVIDGCMCAALRCLILWRVNVSDRPQSPCTPCALLPC